MLLELAMLAQRHPMLPKLAIGLLDKIEDRIASETPTSWAQAVAEEGAVFAQSYAELANTDVKFSGVGQAFGCTRALALGLPPEDERWHCAQKLAEETIAAARGVRLPRSLSLMRLYASQVLANPHGPARRRDGVKLVIHGLTGWPKY